MARCRGIRGIAPIGVIEEGWAMSVDRLAGSGPAGEDAGPARGRRAQRRRTGRRPGTDAGALGLAEPGQTGEATAAPETTAATESNVILLGQEAGPGRSATAPERPAAAPGQAPAAATTHAPETARTEAPPTEDAAAAPATSIAA